MIGREYVHAFPPKLATVSQDKAPVLEARNLSWTDRLKDVSLTVRAGEVARGTRDVIPSTEIVSNGVPRRGRPCAVPC